MSMATHRRKAFMRGFSQFGDGTRDELFKFHDLQKKHDECAGQQLEEKRNEACKRIKAIKAIAKTSQVSVNDLKEAPTNQEFLFSFVEGGSDIIRRRTRLVTLI